MSDTVSSPLPAGRQPLLIGGVLAIMVALLAAGYFLFLRPGYAVLAQNLRPGEASAVVAELKKRNIAYRVEDGGTILVPRDEVEATRLEIAGSDAVTSGQVGFELFNKSDMGLTNFAQKINFQRALQGELVRTIEQLDGVDSARVHLAMPERTLFRGDRSEPRAAVTITMRPGNVADPARVAGIQRLVAAAVPELPESKVVVLDSGGRVISADAAAASPADTDRPADLEERAAVEQYYHARARRAIETRQPGLKFLLRVMALPLDGGTDTAGGGGTAQWTPAGGAARNFRLRVTFVTTNGLNEEEEAIARAAIDEALALDSARGDLVSFQSGPIAPQPAPAAPVGIAPVVAAAPATLQAGTQDVAGGFGFWISAALALVAVAGLIFWRLRAGRRGLDANAQRSFAERLQRQLNLEDA